MTTLKEACRREMLAMIVLHTEDFCGNRAIATGNANANDNVVTTALNGRCKRGRRFSSCVLTAQHSQPHAVTNVPCIIHLNNLH